MPVERRYLILRSFEAPPSPPKAVAPPPPISSPPPSQPRRRSGGGGGGSRVTTPVSKIIDEPVVDEKEKQFRRTVPGLFPGADFGVSAPKTDIVAPEPRISTQDKINRGIQEKYNFLLEQTASKHGVTKKVVDGKIVWTGTPEQISSFQKDLPSVERSAIGIYGYTPIEMDILQKGFMYPGSSISDRKNLVEKFRASRIYKVTGDVPSEYDIVVPSAVESHGFGSEYRRISYERDIGFISENKYRVGLGKLVSGLGPVDRESYYSEVTPWESVPVEHIKYYPGGMKYLREHKEDVIKKFYEKGGFASVAGQPESEKYVELMLRTRGGDYSFAQRLAREGGLGGGGALGKELAYEYLFFKPEMQKERAWGRLPLYAKAGTLFYEQYLVPAVTMPVTAPQFFVKLFHGGKTLVLPDVGEFISEHQIGPSGGVALSVGKLQHDFSGGMGISSGMERAKRDPWGMFFATGGEVFSFWAGGKLSSMAYGRIGGYIKGGVKYVSPYVKYGMRQLGFPFGPTGWKISKVAPGVFLEEIGGRVPNKVFISEFGGKPSWFKTTGKSVVSRFFEETPYVKEYGGYNPFRHGYAIPGGGGVVTPSASVRYGRLGYFKSPESIGTIWSKEGLALAGGKGIAGGKIDYMPVKGQQYYAPDVDVFTRAGRYKEILHEQSYLSRGFKEPTFPNVVERWQPWKSKYSDMARAGSYESIYGVPSSKSGWNIPRKYGVSNIVYGDIYNQIRYSMTSPIGRKSLFDILGRSSKVKVPSSYFFEGYSYPKSLPALRGRMSQNRFMNVLNNIGLRHARKIYAGEPITIRSFKSISASKYKFPKVYRSMETYGIPVEYPSGASKTIGILSKPKRSIVSRQFQPSMSWYDERQIMDIWDMESGVFGGVHPRWGRKTPSQAGFIGYGVYKIPRTRKLQLGGVVSIPRVDTYAKPEFEIINKPDFFMGEIDINKFDFKPDVRQETIDIMRMDERQDRGSLPMQIPMLISGQDTGQRQLTRQMQRQMQIRTGVSKTYMDYETVLENIFDIPPPEQPRGGGKKLILPPPILDENIILPSKYVKKKKKKRKGGYRERVHPLKLPFNIRL